MYHVSPLALSQRESEKCKTLRIEDEFLNPFLERRQLEDQRVITSNNRNPQANRPTAADTVRSKRYDAQRDEQNIDLLKASLLEGVCKMALQSGTLNPSLNRTRIKSSVTKALRLEFSSLRLPKGGHVNSYSGKLSINQNSSLLSPYLGQIDTTRQIQVALNFDTGMHRPWSMPRLYTHTMLNLRRDRCANKLSRTHRAARNAAADGVTACGSRAASSHIGLSAAVWLRLLKTDNKADIQNKTELKFNQAKADLSYQFNRSTNDPYISCIHAVRTQRREPQPANCLPAKLKLRECTKRPNLAPWADDTGRYLTSHEPSAAFTYKRPFHSKKNGRLKGRPGWDQSFCTTVINSNK